MNRINELFVRKRSDICSIFVTAGYPQLNDTVSIVSDLESSGVDLIEIGMPFSDPLADGETIQYASELAIKNGMNINILFNQLVEIRMTSEIPIVLMGYANPIFKYGLGDFLARCEEVGVDGLIIPDISLEEYELNYQNVFDQYNVPLTFLFTPNTSLVRLEKIESLTKTFIYFISSSTTTGGARTFSEQQVNQFAEVQELGLTKPVLMGFGIHDKETFQLACEFFQGGIIGSAFIRSLERQAEIAVFIEEFTTG